MVKEIDLDSDKFMLHHRWLSIAEPSSSSQMRHTFALLETLLRLSEPLTNDQNQTRLATLSDMEQSTSMLFARQARLICLRVLLTLLQAMSSRAKSRMMLSPSLMQTIFKLAGNSKSRELPVPSQGEARACVSQSSIKVGDFVRSPGDSPQSESSAADLIGCVQSVSF